MPSHGDPWLGHHLQRGEGGVEIGPPLCPLAWEPREHGQLHLWRGCSPARKVAD